MKILKSAMDQVEEAKKMAEPCGCKAPETCERCNGEGAAVMSGTYVGDVEGQHDVCPDCRGTGWKNGKAWLAEMAKRENDLNNQKVAIECRVRQCDRRDVVFADDEKMAKRAMEMLKGLDAREKAFAEAAADLHRAHEKHRDAVNELDRRTNDSQTALDADRLELEAVRAELEEMRESIRKPLKRLIREVEAMRSERKTT